MSEHVLLISELEAIELLALDKDGDYCKLMIRHNSDVTDLPNAISRRKAEFKAFQLSDALQIPVFTLKHGASIRNLSDYKRLPYYSPTTTNEVLEIAPDDIDSAEFLTTYEENYDLANSNCPFCGTILRNAAIVACTDCHTPHHLECFKNYGVCTTYACRSNTYISVKTCTTTKTITPENKKDQP